MSPRKDLETFGRKRKNHVRVVRETNARGSRIRVYWNDRVTKGRRAEKFEDSREGKAKALAFAEGVYVELMQTAPPVGEASALPQRTVREIWEAYKKARFSLLRGASQVTLANRWKVFELFAGRNRAAASVTREMLEELTDDLRGRSPNQIRLTFQVVRLVFRWAIERALIPPSAVTTFRPEFSKDALAKEPAMKEFRAADTAKILAKLDPRASRQWRPWAVTAYLADSGARKNATLHLAWPDVDFAARTVTYQPEWDKTGKRRVQPMTPGMMEALWVAYGWRIAAGYTGPWVFFGGKKRTRGDASREAWELAAAPEKLKAQKRSTGAIATTDAPWTYSAYLRQLDQTCKRAGVAREKYQGAHGFRRGISGDIADRTGSTKKAAEWIGDTDVRVVEKHYVLSRDDSLRAIADSIPSRTEERP
jgi:integrase